MACAVPCMITLQVIAASRSLVMVEGLWFLYGLVSQVRIVWLRLMLDGLTLCIDCIPRRDGESPVANSRRAAALQAPRTVPTKQDHHHQLPAELD